MKYLKPFSILPIFSLMLMSFNSYASEFNGQALSLYWAIPFVGILLSIALCPLFLARLWHYHYGKIVAIWTFIFLGSALFSFGLFTTIELTVHAIIEEYIPFILLLLTLFTVSGGILIKSDKISTPKSNVILLAVGVVLVSVMGTTGAAMLMIRPLLRANRQRQYAVHTVIFFIFLVANIGGGLTPLGDPPLFIGFLKGVDFFWTVKHMLLPVVLTSGLLLIIYYFIDRYYYVKQYGVINNTISAEPVKLYGLKNLVLLVAIIASVLLSGVWHSSLYFTLLGS